MPDDMSDQDFDEEFYLSQYPDIREAVLKGAYKNGRQHYDIFGEREQRLINLAQKLRRRDLMLGFCSLGHNCEVGIAQRRFGAEPLDLFRWAGTRHEVLLALLEARFDRLADPDLIEVSHTQQGGYFVGNRHYGFKWHAWGGGGKIEPEAIRVRELKRLPFLARKLVDDLSEGRRIFVIMGPRLNDDVVSEISAAMAAYGSPTLLHVSEGGPVELTRVDDRLLRGKIPQYADVTRVRATTPAKDWLTLCLLVRDLVPTAESFSET